MIKLAHKIALILLASLLLILPACNPSDSVTGNVIKENKEVGNIEAKNSIQIKDEWCKKDALWELNEIENKAKMKITGIETGGKYKGYCHISYELFTSDAKSVIDYYFNEEGDGYQILTINGESVVTEFKNN